MKLKLMILVAGAFLGVAYLVGCGGGGNNNNNGNCQAGYTWNGANCVYGAYNSYGVNGGQGNCGSGSIWSTQAGTCVQACNYNGTQGGFIGGQCQYVPSNCGYAGGQGYNGYQGYQGNQPGFDFNQPGCSGIPGQGGPIYPGGGGQWGPYPVQYPYQYNPGGGNSVFWSLNFGRGGY
jgi:hypothetical protein